MQAETAIQSVDPRTVVRHSRVQRAIPRGCATSRRRFHRQTSLDATNPDLVAPAIGRLSRRR